MPELLERVHERTRPLETRCRVDDLVAVGLAAPALGLVLRVQRKALDAGADCSTPELWAQEPGLRKT